MIRFISSFSVPSILALGVVVVSTLLLSSCARPDAEQGERQSVVLYSSADDYMLAEIAAEFEKQTGIRVDILGDTEATKTTGLMQRLLAERENPRADVWWSSEPFATERLARDGMFEPVPAAVLETLPAEWPKDLIDPNNYWVGFALRARVLVVRTGIVAEDDLPRTLEDLTHERWRGKVGIARPEFGTTRGHFAALVEACGAEAFEDWLVRMKANGVRIYSGNATVVKAVADGEIHVGLTDTDDIWVGQRNGWPVRAVYEVATPTQGLCSFGAMWIPNTVARVAGGPNPENATKLMQYLLSKETARRIAETDSHNIPVYPDLVEEFRQWAPDTEDGGTMPPTGPVADRVPEAIAIVERVLGGP